jgi:hypothetical protein
MITEIKIAFKQSKYGSDYAAAELNIDTDECDDEALRTIVSGIVNSAIRRRDEKLSREQKPAPPDAPVEIKPQEAKVF